MHFFMQVTPVVQRVEKVKNEENRKMMKIDKMILKSVFLGVFSCF